MKQREDESDDDFEDRIHHIEEMGREPLADDEDEGEEEFEYADDDSDED